jgi:hypothetical protein
LLRWDGHTNYNGQKFIKGRAERAWGLSGEEVLVVNFKKMITVAEGYLELEMFEDALEELEALPGEEARASDGVRSLRLRGMMGMKRWSDGAALAREWVQENASCLDIYLWGAYCIRRAESLEEGCAFLLSAPLADVEDSPALSLYWFNLGCYRCQLGNHGDALDLVARAIDAEPGFAKLALEDEDLEPIREELAAEWTEID